MSELDVCTRLYRAPRRSLKPPKTANDALISDLPGDTLRWIKNRRRLDSETKMVLSHNRERQLRDIFNGIDIGKHGSIDLEELTEAVSFVAERMKNKVGAFQDFGRILEIFRSMDDNGDGEVDFREFTNAMSGSSKSALDKASEQDISTLHRCFLEFGVLKSRRTAISKINEYTGLSFAGESTRNFKSATREEEEEEMDKHRKRHSEGVVVDDLQKYNLFRTLFEEKRDANQVVRVNQGDTSDIVDVEKTLTADEQLLREFHNENKRLYMNGVDDPELEAEYDALRERLKEARIREAEKLARDPDAVAIQLHHAEALKYFSKSRKNTTRRASSNPVLVTVDGKPIVNSLHAATALSLPPPDTRKDMIAQLRAKKEAYDIIRSLRYLTPLEKQNRLSIQSGVGIPPPIEIPAYERSEEVTSAPSTRSSMKATRSSSNLPTSRTHRQRAALQQSRSLAAILSDSDRPSTAPTRPGQTYTLTPKAFKSVTPVSVRAAGTPVGVGTPLGGTGKALGFGRPQTANAAHIISSSSVSGKLATVSRPQSSGAIRLNLRTPKHMHGGM